MQRLRAKYGAGPLLLPVPIQAQALILAPQHVRTVLDNSAEPFAVATALKKTALAHFEPKNVLVSHGAERAERRQFHEEALDFHSPVHRLAEGFIEVVNREAENVLERAGRHGELTWDAFIQAWYRMVRRVVFGDSARDDTELTDMLARLRGRGNWAFASPKNKALRERFLAQVQERLNRAEPGSIASLIARMPKSADTAPEQQVPQWLFAFDPAGMTTFRALAVLASHPVHMQRARVELDADMTERQHLPFLRACILETLRLWPTTPMILRESTRATTWDNGAMPAKTSILIYAPYFHRDDQNLDYAHQFMPDIWLNGAADEWPLVPFSGGPGTCPGKQLVLLLTSAMLAAILDRREVSLIPPTRLDPAKPLPATLNNYGLRFGLRPLEVALPIR
jgi:cytochrome P450